MRAVIRPTDCPCLQCMMDVAAMAEKIKKSGIARVHQLKLTRHVLYHALATCVC